MNFVCECFGRCVCADLCFLVDLCAPDPLPNSTSCGACCDDATGKKEVEMCVAQAAKHSATPFTTKNRTFTRAASICIHYSPWFYVFPKGAGPTEFPEKAALEVALWARNLKKIAVRS